VIKNKNPGSVGEPGLLSVVAGTRNYLHLLLAGRCRVLTGTTPGCCEQKVPAAQEPRDGRGSQRAFG
jgi:hypothetical protein